MNQATMNYLSNLAKKLGVVLSSVEVYDDCSARINYVDGTHDDFKLAAHAEKAIRKMAE